MSRGQYKRSKTKITTKERLFIDINNIDKDGFIDDGWLTPYQLNNNEYIYLKIKPNWLKIKEYDQIIKLDKTACNFGGMRNWFLCPSCKSRVVILYLDADKFSCRNCLNLVYMSQRRDQLDRLAIKIWKIRKKLGGSGNIFEPIYKKPKGMHWKTYVKLKQQELSMSKEYVQVFTDHCNISL